MWRLRLSFSSRLSRLPFRRTRRRIVRSSGGGSGGSGDIKSAAGDGGQRRGLGSIWVAYLKELEKRPVITKMWTSGVINAAGDVLAQNLFETNQPFDWRRFGIFSTLGLLMVGPVLHYWYALLARVFSSAGLRSAVGSLMLDQFAFAPAFLGVILSTLVVAETRRVSSVKPKLDQDWVPTVVMNWKMWIPAQLVNFWVVPPNLRVLFSNIVALVWTTYLSYGSHKRVKATQ